MSSSVIVRAPELLAVVWLPGTAALCVLSVADTYTGLLAGASALCFAGYGYIM